MTIRLTAAFARLDEFVEQRMQTDQTPGVAIGLTNRQRLLRVTTYGSADLAARRPVTPDTLFATASIGKSFTAIALLRLHEAGRLDLHAPVTAYLPWFRLGSTVAPITLHHLLSHTAGISAGIDATPDARAEVWSLRATEAGAPPGSRFHYSNVGFKVLGLVLEAVTGQRYGEAIHELILAPLGLTATAPVLTHALRPRLAVGYQPLYDDRPAQPSHPLVPAPWVETDTGDGCLASTPAEMATYLRLLLNQGHGPHGRLLSAASFDLLTAPVIEAAGFAPSTTYGYGLSRRTVDGRTIIGHPGGMPGYAAWLLGDLDDGLGAVVLVNGPGAPGRIATFALRLLSAAHRGQALPPLPAANDPRRVANAGEYAGVYRSGERVIQIVAQGEGLLLLTEGQRIGLLAHDEDAFLVADPAWERFVLRFGRVAGQVVEALHGPDWYAGTDYRGPRRFRTPAAWAAYVGHYRAHNPWLPGFRVVLRKGDLLLILPSGADGFEEEQPLIPLGRGRFRVGAETGGPERLCFDQLVNGQALRATLSGGAYYRFFTP